MGFLVCCGDKRCSSGLSAAGEVVLSVVICLSVRLDKVWLHTAYSGHLLVDLLKT